MIGNLDDGQLTLDNEADEEGVEGEGDEDDEGDEGEEEEEDGGGEVRHFQPLVPHQRGERSSSTDPARQSLAVSGLGPTGWR